MPVEIHRATPELADRLTEIAFAAKRHWGYSKRDIERWAPELTFSASFIERHAVYAARAGDTTAGVYALLDNGDRTELEHFWVDPSCMGSGVGRAMFRHAVERVSRGSAVALDISCDPNAEGFYIKMGARRVGSVAAPIEGDEGRVLPRLVYRI